MTSARRDEVALDTGPTPGYSLFTGAMIQALTSGAADMDRNGIITFSELALYLQQTVGQTSGSRQVPDYGAFYLDDRGEFVLGGTREALTQLNSALAHPAPQPADTSWHPTNHGDPRILWLDIEIELENGHIRLSARGSRGERPLPHKICPDKQDFTLQSFMSKVGRAVRLGKTLEPEVVNYAQALHRDFFQGELRDVVARLVEAAKENRVVVRLFMSRRELQAIPWEALCKPETAKGFLGIDPKLLVARGVPSRDPCEPRAVRSAVRVLVIAPEGEGDATAALFSALGSLIQSGEVEWLDPIVGPIFRAHVLFNRLRSGKSPHVVHFLGHGGVDLQGRPTLRLADDEDGEEQWITVESLARELHLSFMEDLRLVILESGEGGKAGAFGSAGEILSKAGADAVVAYLWPVRADTSQRVNVELYRTLTGAERASGDIGAALAAARSTLLTESAEAFSPVLYLRAANSVLFNFKNRKVAQPRNKSKSKRLAPALQHVLEKPFTLVLGDDQEDRSSLKKQIEQFLADQGITLPPNLPLSALMQQCAMRYGIDVLHSIFQTSMMEQMGSASPFIEAMGQLAPPGVHVTLLWQPHLERAIAAAQPQKNVYAIQPSLRSSGKARVLKRAAGTNAWKMEVGMPGHFDFDNDILVLRIYGGYSAEARPIFSQPLLTEDDHLFSLKNLGWIEEMLSQPRTRPGLLAGLTLRKWRHRLLLRWLYDERPPPKDSLAIVSPNADPAEPGIWDSGGWLDGAGHVAVVTEEFGALATLLEEASLQNG
ncbi:MAG TPA: CHAT domain-containing protein [Polyangium sp.]|nr:CHAT domain-containing protein [Polyangium sp.]